MSLSVPKLLGWPKRLVVRDMFVKHPKFNWQDITVKIVNAPCVWDATIIHEVVEVIS